MSTKRILIAEDATGLRVLLKKVLAELGYSDVIEAENGQVALEKFKATWMHNKSICLILTDIQMPTMNGLDFIKNVRSIVSKDEVPVIVLSVESDRETIVEAVQLGANDYMIKPIAKAALQTKLEKWIKN